MRWEKFEPQLLIFLFHRSHVIRWKRKINECINKTTYLFIYKRVWRTNCKYKRSVFNEQYELDSPAKTAFRSVLLIEVSTKKKLRGYKICPKKVQKQNTCLYARVYNIYTHIICASSAYTQAPIGAEKNRPQKVANVNKLQMTHGALFNRVLQPNFQGLTLNAQAAAAAHQELTSLLKWGWRDQRQHSLRYRLIYRE